MMKTVGAQIQEIHDELEQVQASLAAATDKDEVEDLTYALIDLQKRFANHPDYLDFMRSRQTLISKLKRFGTKLLDTGRGVLARFGQHDGNTN